MQKTLYALMVLVQKPTWRLNSLPDGVDPDWVRVLYHDGLIEIQPWNMMPPADDPFNLKDQKRRPSPWRWGWNSSSDPHQWPRGWDDLVRISKDSPGLSAELRVSERGKAELVRLQKSPPPVFERGGLPDNGEAGPIRGEALPSEVKTLAPAVQRAWASWRGALRAEPELAGKTDRAVFEWIVEHGDNDYQLAQFDNWSKYLRIARKRLGQQKNTRRGSRKARSVIHVSEK